VQGTDALLSLYQVEFDGLPLTLQTTSRDATTHVLEGISFVNMGDDETQLTLEVPGSPTGAPLQINAPVFDAPVAVGYFLEARNAPGVNDPLLVRLNGPTPASAIAGEDYLAVGNVQITWGP
jgi:hypothetical protein